MPGKGWEALSYLQEWSVGPPGCPGMVGRPSRISGSGRETLLDVREFLLDFRVWSEGPLG